MPPLDERLARIETSVGNLVSLVQTEIEDRKKDHDSIVAFCGEVSSLRKAFDEREMESRKDHDALVLLSERADVTKNRVNGIKGDKKEEDKAKWARIWQVAFILLAALSSGLVGAIVTLSMQAIR